MLYTSYKNVIERGIYIDSSFKEYKGLNLQKLSKTFYGLSTYRFLYYFLRFEYQLLNTKFPKNYNNKYLLYYKIINHYYFQILPVPYKFSSLRNLNIIRKYAIRMNKGICHKRGKPVNGQRTWSNASNAKYNNTYLRNYLQELERTKKSTRLTDQWA